MSRVAIITGAGSGIGRATAVLLSRNHYSVTLVGRNTASLQETEKLLSGPALTIAADISSADACRDVISRTEATWKRIDVLVNNAGYAPMVPIEETGPSVIDEVFRINALGSAYLIHHVWPVFLKQKNGCIVNVSSMSSIDPFTGLFAYAAAKASVNLMALSCARDGKDHGVRAFAVAPGSVETAMLRKLVSEKDLPRHRTLSPDDVAQVIVECIEGKRDAQNGATIPIPSPP